MNDDGIIQPLLNKRPLTVDIVDGEIVLDGFASMSPSLTVDAARETGRRLIEAADTLARLQSN